MHCRFIRIKIASMVIVMSLFISCNPALKSVVDPSLHNAPYKSLLFVMSFPTGDVESIFWEIRAAMTEQLKKENVNAEFLLIKHTEQQLKLNASDELNNRISSIVTSGKKDVVFIFQPVELSYSNSRFYSGTFLITGKDVKSEKEIWKSQILANKVDYDLGFGGKKAATRILKKMKADKLY